MMGGEVEDIRISFDFGFFCSVDGTSSAILKFQISKPQYQRHYHLYHMLVTEILPADLN